MGTRLQLACTGQAASVLNQGYRVHMADNPVKQMRFLRSIPLFSDLNDDMLRFLAEEAHNRIFQEGELVFFQGDPGRTCHIITKGRVRVFVQGEDGRELAISILGPGEIVGEMALFEDLPRSASIEAVEETHTLELYQETVLRGVQRSPQLALSLLRALSSRLRSTTEDAEGLASLPVSERLIRRLHRLAQWAGRPEPDGIRIALPMTQQELAALVGTSRESVNRALVRLRQQGRVRLDDGWIVLISEDVGFDD